MKDFDLGAYSRKITVGSTDAQFWFDKGLNWVVGFNHEAGDFRNMNSSTATGR